MTTGATSESPASGIDELHSALRHHVVNSLGWSTLRPLQAAAFGPLSAGNHALLVAPTAGGKTEAAVLPVLSRMIEQQWRGLSVLYVCPLRALLNNLEPRLTQLCGFGGRRAALWHGDVGAGGRAAIRRDPPDVLLTTPESLEAMLISVGVDHRVLFADLQAIIVDEVHAFAGDDRGWHLLAVLSRLQRLAGREIQRLGLSATVGNPSELLVWLTQGCDQPAEVISPVGTVGSAANADVTLDYVGGVANAAVVISRLHRGEKRLVFADSRRRVEELAVALRGHDVTTFVSHSSLSVDERRRAETAFSEARDCVIVATSTLELGIDVGDLDRVIQLDAPPSVASFLQRLGRTGRRPGATRNTLFLATRSESLLEAAALTRLWADGYVEPIVPPAEPWHLLAQQLLAVVLQERQVGRALWHEWFVGLAAFDECPEAAAALAHLVEAGFLFDDDGMLSVGPDAERSFGRRNFLELTSVFTADPLVEVLTGNDPVGQVHPLSLERRDDGQPTVLLLGGRAWAVEHVDWRHRRAWVKPAEGMKGRSRWGGSPRGLSAAHAGAIRSILAGVDPGADLSERATRALEQTRADFHWLQEGATALVPADGGYRWWTFAGLLANAELALRLGGDTIPQSLWLPVPEAVAKTQLRQRASTAATGMSPLALQLAQHLKFAECLPAELSARTAAARLTDSAAVARCLAEPMVIV